MFGMGFNKRFDEIFPEKFSKEFSTESKDLREDLTNQLLTMVGMFTALAFLVFGSINGLAGAFQVTGTPILKLMCTGSLWGFCVLNLVFVFLYCVAKITNKDLSSKRYENGNVVQRYPLVFWCDYFTGTILLCSLWLYYLRNQKGLVWLDSLFKNGRKEPSLIGSAIVIGVVAVTGTLIYLKGKGLKLGRRGNKNT